MPLHNGQKNEGQKDFSDSRASGNDQFTSLGYGKVRYFRLWELLNDWKTQQRFRENLAVGAGTFDVSVLQAT